MNEDLLKAIHQELVAIRQLLANGNAAPARSASPSRGTAARSSATAASSASSSSGGGGGGDAPIPQPTEIVPNAGDVAVHFGKNNGVPLSKLGERSLSWYAQEQAPRLDSSGNPYPPRPQETLLRNAARTLWHQMHGTLAQPGGDSMKLPAEAFSEPAPHPADEEALPF